VGTYRRGSDGRRHFSPEFKREQISRVMRQELTLAELSRELNVQPTVIRRWTHLIDRGSTTAVAANDDVVPASEPGPHTSASASSNDWWARRRRRSRSSRRRETKSKNAALVRRVHAMSGRRVALICRVLGIGRAAVYRPERNRGPRCAKADDRVVTAQMPEVIRTRATYGARRVHALVNRASGRRTT